MGEPELPIRVVDCPQGLRGAHSAPGTAVRLRHVPLAPLVTLLQATVLASVTASAMAGALLCAGIAPVTTPALTKVRHNSSDHAERRATYDGPTPVTSSALPTGPAAATRFESVATNPTNVEYVTFTPAAHAAGEFRSLSYRGVRPVPGRVIRAFDPPAHPWLSGHRGVDLAAEVGESVRSPLAGHIHFVGVVGGIPRVSIDHAGGLLSSYQPVTSALVAGDAVGAGDIIGTIAPDSVSHSHCANECLHLGARQGEVYLHPMRALRLWAVLLPHDDE